MSENLHVVVGLGKTGLSCVRYLLSQNLPVVVTDSRLAPPNLAELQIDYPDVPLFLGEINAEVCARAHQIILSPGVSLQEPALAQAIKKGIPVIGDIELFALHANAPVIAITGSNGKSTVTTLVAEMAAMAGLQVKVGGNLGTPALDLLSTDITDLYVLELSSFQLETTNSLKTVAAVILNLCEDHMDRYHNLDEYLKAKQRIYKNCANPLVNREAPELTAGLNLENIRSFGMDAPLPNQFGLKKVGNNLFLALGEDSLINVNELKIKGRHQLANALAALALGSTMHLPLPAMLNTLRKFEGLPHRSQWVANYGGVDWYNDSKATNVGAAQASLEGLGEDVGGKLVLIAGGLGKNADFSLLRPAVEKHVRLLILIGKDAPLLESALKGSTSIKHANSLEKAVSLAHKHAHSGDAVLLAPACASFDMFKNFEHRGDSFISAVKALT